MEGSASAPALPSKPTLQDEDYRVPGGADCRGIGDTGLQNRITHGPMAKDKGTYSSRINQIVKQAEKVPGPGKYVAHEPWEEGKTAHTIHAGNKFPAGNRDYKPMNKTPAPATYEDKNFYLGTSITSKDSLSNNPRIIYGQIPKGKKRSSLDQAVAHAAKMPGAGHYTLSQKRNNKLDTQSTHSAIKTMDWRREAQKTTGKQGSRTEIEIGPNHYTINYNQTEEKQAVNTIPKAKAQNFLDKAVKEKLVDLKTRKEVPGPGTRPRLHRSWLTSISLVAPK